VLCKDASDKTFPRYDDQSLVRNQPIGWSNWELNEYGNKDWHV